MATVHLVITLVFCGAVIWYVFAQLKTMQQALAETFESAIGLIGATVASTGEAVGRAVQTATTSLLPPPLPPRTIDEVAREFANAYQDATDDPLVTMADPIDPTDEVVWLRGERPGAVFANADDPSPFGIPGLGFPPPNGDAY